MSYLHPHEVVHNCGKFTYENVEIYWEEKSKTWNIDIDSEAGAVIFYCPFCGDKLPKV